MPVRDVFQVSDQPLQASAENSAWAIRGVAAAERVRQHLLTLPAPDRATYVEDLIEKSDDVFGLWLDPTERFGIAVHVIKQGPTIAAFRASQEPLPLSDENIAYIPCIDYEQAVALQKTMGQLRD